MAGPPGSATLIRRCCGVSAGVAALVEGGGWTKMVVRSTVGLGLGRGASVLRFVACRRRVTEAPHSDLGFCLDAGASSNYGWQLLSLAAPLAPVLFTDVGRKLRQERFASALLVL